MVLFETRLNTSADDENQLHDLKYWYETEDESMSRGSVSSRNRNEKEESDIHGSFLSRIDSDMDVEIDSVYKLYIDPDNTLYNFIFGSKTQNKQNNNPFATQTTTIKSCGKKCLFSSTAFWICSIYGIGYAIITAIINYDINGYVFIALLVLLEIAVVVPVLSFNVQIVKFATSTFVFWWKLLDACIFYIMYQVIEYTNHTYEWSFTYTDSLVECWILAVAGGLVIITAVMAISSSQAFINSLKHKKLVCNMLIMSAIIYFMYHAVSYFIDDGDDYNIHISSLGWDFRLSCRTAVVSKAIDCSIFFLTQLYQSIRFGFSGIYVTGFVQRRWQKIRRYKVQQHDQFESTHSVQLINVTHY